MKTVDRATIKELSELNDQAHELAVMARIKARDVPAAPEAAAREVEYLFDRISTVRDTVLTVLRERGDDPTYIGCALQALQSLHEAATLMNASGLRGVRAAMQNTNSLARGLSDLMFGATQALEETHTINEVGDPALDAASLRAMQMVDVERTVDSLFRHARLRGDDLNQHDVAEMRPVMERVQRMVRFSLLHGTPASPDLLSRGSEALDRILALAKRIVPKASTAEHQKLATLSVKLIAAGREIAAAMPKHPGGLRSFEGF